MKVSQKFSSVAQKERPERTFALKSDSAVKVIVKSDKVLMSWLDYFKVNITHSRGWWRDIQHLHRQQRQVIQKYRDGRDENELNVNEAEKYNIFNNNVF